MPLETFIERLKQEEGFSPVSFWDDAKGGGGGQWTWGYGTKAPGPGYEITKEEAENLLRWAVDECVEVFRRIFKDCEIPEGKAWALIDMIYNMGESRFRKFKKLIRAVKAENWENAGLEVRSSIYYGQVTSRAEENAEILESKS